MIFLNSLTNEQVLLLVVFPIGLIFGFVSFCFVIYLKMKWLKLVEDEIDRGYYSFSSNIFSAGVGVSRYALIFQFDWQAKRCNRLKERDKIPKEIQRLFILSHIFLLIGLVIAFGAALLHSFIFNR
ncbi:hypothetical protein [Psychromonas antarctica]|uniref:hypothetical protein n=1 Tax=Psychromonas antarctica TaxID=67573 RepID=UPI001EE815D3|nr:hypothetical protein [Psychromonas antarctica]MCG6202917.1 hypothetical protein [Psychromonas antarctica]